jgi:two-component system, LuxR family, response regulator FixJ
MQAEPTIFVIDDDAANCRAVTDLAKTMRLPCEVFGSGTEFLDSYDGSRGGCVLSELKLNDMSGLHLQQLLVERGLAVPFLFLTAHATPAMAVRAMRAGAHHFLEKPFRAEELWEAIQEAITAERAARGFREQQERLRQRLGTLTIKEEQVLHLVATGKSNRAIAKELDVSVRTIEFRRAALMKKLAVRDQTELLRVAIIVCDELASLLGADRNHRNGFGKPFPQTNGHQSAVHGGKFSAAFRPTAVRPIL